MQFVNFLNTIFLMNVVMSAVTTLYESNSSTFFVSNFLRSGGGLRHCRLLRPDEFCQFFVASHAILLAAVRQAVRDLLPAVATHAGGVGLQGLLEKLLLVGGPGRLKTK